MNKVLAYSFFRHDSSHYEHPNCGEARGRVFLNYVRLLVRAHFAVWFGWELRFYHDDRVMYFPYFRVLQALECEGLLKLHYAGKATTLCQAMMWRMRPAWDPDVDIVVCRDVDSVPLPRDRRACEEFVRSGLAVHVVHDASAHSGIMGGTIGLNAAKWRDKSGFPTLSSFEHEAYSAYPTDRWNEHGCDQNFLNAVVLPRVRQDLLLHELHHITGDMGIPPLNIRMRILGDAPEGMRQDVATLGDQYSRIIGGCSDVEAPFAFYDALDIPEINIIAKIEKEVLR